MLYILLYFVLVLCFVDYVVNHNEKASLVKKVPGFKSHFLIGDSLQIIVSPVELFRLGRKFAQKYKNIYSFYALTFAAVNIYNPEDVETVVSTMKYHEKSLTYSFLQPWLRDGLLLSSGPKWHQRRKILTSAFHFNVLRQYYIIFQENNERLLRTLKKNAGNSTDVVSLFSNFTLNTICESAMGTQLNTDTSKSGIAYKKAILDIGKALFNRFIKVYLYPNFFFYLSSFGKLQSKSLSIIHNFTQNVIKQRREYLENNKIEMEKIVDNEEDLYYTSVKKKMAMLDLLISAEKEGLIDKIGVQEEVDTFMFEGHDTTSSALTFFVLCLANLQDIQEKIVRELRALFGDTRRAATMDDLNKMYYLELCIKETLRLYPPVPFISRKLSETVNLSGYTIPAGTFCNIHIYDLHRTPDIYENPLEFIPERFLPENCVKRHNFAYIPFSAGPRNCIGQKFAMIELKSVLTAIFRNYTLVPVTKPSDLVFTADMILRNSEPIFAKFIKREDSF